MSLSAPPGFCDGAIIRHVTSFRNSAIRIGFAAKLRMHADGIRLPTPPHKFACVTSNFTATVRFRPLTGDA